MSGRPGVRAGLVAAALVCASAMVAGAHRSRAQESVASPAAPLDAQLTALDLSFSAVDLSFAGSSVTFSEGSLSLPPGFGVALTDGVRPVPAQVGAPVSAPNAAPAVALTPVPADVPPPTARPRDANLNTAGFSFSSASLSFGTASASFGNAAATVGGAGSGLGGSTIDLPGLAVREEGGGYRFTLGADVLFDFDKFQLRPEAGPILQKLVAEVRSKVPSARWQVEGHTDAKGSDAYNDRLSDRRADSVRNWLTLAGGVAAGEIATLSFGERRPVAPNSHPDGSDNPEGRQLNRRVEILVTPL